jgi:hypothetical protein
MGTPPGLRMKPGVVVDDNFRFVFVVKAFW